MRHRVVVEVGVFEDGRFDVVVCGQVAQIHQSRALHVGPATAPKTDDARVRDDFAKKKKNINCDLSRLKRPLSLT